MLVFCVFHKFECTIEKPNGERDTLEYGELSAIRLSQRGAQQYISEQTYEIQKRLSIEIWNAE